LQASRQIRMGILFPELFSLEERSVESQCCDIFKIVCPPFEHANNLGFWHNYDHVIPHTKKWTSCYRLKTSCNKVVLNLYQDAFVLHLFVHVDMVMWAVNKPLKSSINTGCTRVHYRERNNQTHQLCCKRYSTLINSLLSLP
jgi:hypothetical protein